MNGHQQKQQQQESDNGTHRQDLSQVRSMARDLDKLDREAKRAARQARISIAQASMTAPATGSSVDGSNSDAASSTLGQQQQKQKDREAKRAARIAVPSTAYSSVLGGSVECAEFRSLTRELDEKDRAAKAAARQAPRGTAAASLSGTAQLTSTEAGLYQEFKVAARTEPSSTKDTHEGSGIPVGLHNSTSEQSSVHPPSSREQQRQDRAAKRAEKEVMFRGRAVGVGGSYVVCNSTLQTKSAVLSYGEVDLLEEFGENSRQVDYAAAPASLPESNVMTDPTPGASVPGAFRSQLAHGEDPSVHDTIQSSSHNSNERDPPALLSTQLPAIHGQRDEVLVEAALVDKEDPQQPTGFESVNPIAEAKVLDENEMASSFLKSRKGRRLIACVLFVFLVVVVGLAVGLSTSAEHDGFASPAVATTMAPTLTPTSLLESEQGHLLLDTLNLSNKTLTQVFQEPESAQAQAMGWMLEDPNLLTMTVLQKAQRFHLATLYFATDGFNWTNSTNWLDYDQAGECSWYLSINAEQTLCNTDGRITALALDDNNLIGEFPEEISFLAPALAYLDLHSNVLWGRVPSQMGILTSLSYLDLSHNALSYSVPIELGSLISLQVLRLSNNLLSGTVPSQLTTAQNLSSLFLSDNVLIGPLASELFLLPRLMNMDLSSNSLSSSLPTELGLAYSLVGLDLSSNKMTGAIPTEIGTAASLVNLDLENNNITGTLPDELSSLGSLSMLRVGSNLISGTLPSSLGQMRNLCFIDASSNFIRGTFPAEFSKLCYDDGLNSTLPFMVLKGSIWSSLQFNNLTQSILVHVEKTVSNILEIQFIGFAGVNTTIVERGSYMGDNGVLDINLNIHFEQESLPSLQTVRNAIFPYQSPLVLDFLWDTNKTTQLKVFLEHFQRLHIDMSYNYITGTLPADLFKSAPLAFFNVDENSITGTIPFEVGAATSLMELSLSGNQIVGSIPSFPDSLQEVDLSDNELSGSIPVQFGMMSNLWRLSLRSNLITGSIDGLFHQPLQPSISTATLPGPDFEFSRGRELCYLDVSSNSLSGSLPAEIGSLCFRDLYSSNTTIAVAFRATYGFHDARRHNVVMMPYEYEIEPVRQQSARLLADELKGHFPDLRHVDLMYLNESVASTLLNSDAQTLSIDYLAAMAFDAAPGPGHMDIVSVLDNKTIFVDYVTNYLRGIELGGTLFDANSSIANAHFMYLNIPNPTTLLPPVTLDLSMNNLTGTIPSEMAALCTLESQIVLLGNAFTGTLPLELCPWLCLEESNGTKGAVLIVDCDQVDCNHCDCKSERT